jgi:dCMP deaminase
VKQVLLYLPVIHAGYEEFLREHADASEILLLGRGFQHHYRELAKDIRALDPQRAAVHVALIAPRVRVRVIEPADLPVAITADLLVLPEEDLIRDLVARYALASGRDLRWERTFLRWDREWATQLTPVHFDGEITADVAARTLFAEAVQAAGHSSDWWRQVGAVAARDGQVIGQAWNRHLPTDYTPYIDGDPRDAFARGVRADLSTAIHAEAAVIGQAARSGIALAGADLFTTTFPCPACAYLIAEAGFTTCLFTGQYSVLDGERVLRAAGVRLVWVDVRPPGLTPPAVSDQPGGS